MSKSEILSERIQCYEQRIPGGTDPMGLWSAYYAESRQTAQKNDDMESLDVQGQAVECIMLAKLVEQTDPDNVNWKTVLASLDTEQRTTHPSLFSPDTLPGVLNLSAFHKVSFPSALHYIGVETTYSRYGSMQEYPAGETISGVSLRPFNEDVILVHTLVGQKEQDNSSQFSNVDFTYIRSKATQQPLYVSIEERRHESDIRSVQTEPIHRFMITFQHESSSRDNSVTMTIDGTARKALFQATFYNVRKQLR